MSVARLLTLAMIAIAECAEGRAKDDAVAVAGHFLDCQCWWCERPQEVSVDEAATRSASDPSARVTNSSRKTE